MNPTATQDASESCLAPDTSLTEDDVLRLLGYPLQLAELADDLRLSELWLMGHGLEDLAPERSMYDLLASEERYTELQRKVEGWNVGRAERLPYNWIKNAFYTEASSWLYGKHRPDTVKSGKDPTCKLIATVLARVAGYHAKSPKDGSPMRAITTYTEGPISPYMPVQPSGGLQGHSVLGHFPPADVRPPTSSVDTSIANITNALQKVSISDQSTNTRRVDDGDTADTAEMTDEDQLAERIHQYARTLSRLSPKQRATIASKYAETQQLQQQQSGAGVVPSFTSPTSWSSRLKSYQELKDNGSLEHRPLSAAQLEERAQGRRDGSIRRGSP